MKVAICILRFSSIQQCWWT